MLVYQKIREAQKAGSKQFALLLDPDKSGFEQLPRLIDNAKRVGVDYFFVGGSLMINDVMQKLILEIKKHCSIPVVLFPGSVQQINENADAILFLSLLSGRNPDLLIGEHVKAAPMLKKMDLEVISTGYLLIDGGRPTTASYISNTFPIPHDKPEIAACTAMAGEFLGMKNLYLDTGSGAMRPVSPQTINLVRQSVDLPIIVGGGIRTPEQAFETCEAGANIVVVGTAVEEDASLLADLAAAVHSSGKRPMWT